MKKKLIFSALSLMLFFALGVSAQDRAWNQPGSAAQIQAYEEGQVVHYSVLDANGDRVTGVTNKAEVRANGIPGVQPDVINWSTYSADQIANLKNTLITQDAADAFATTQGATGKVIDLLFSLNSQGQLTATEITAAEALYGIDL